MVRRFCSQSALLSLLLPFAIICNLVTCEELKQPSCNNKDKQILLCFKHGLTDPSGMLSTWSNKEDCCEWLGVQCDTNGRVTNLSLPCSTHDSVKGISKNKTHCLAGEFHLSLLQLEFLNFLNLSNNDFKAIHLPLDCHNLSLVNSSSNLAYLDLSFNENLVMNDLRWLIRLSSLEYLNLGSIDLHKQTQWLQILTMLPSLSELHLSSCLLESASPSLEYAANFTSLEYLDLSGNDFFSKLPSWIFNLTGLSYLNLEENRFLGQIPNTLLNLRNLHYLLLGSNQLSGPIPNWLGQHESLRYLVLRENSFTGPIPTTLGNLSSLIDFDVISNDLTGSLPESLGQLSNLEGLGVGHNSLSGVVSHRNFAKLSKLQKLWLASPSFNFDFDPHWIPHFQLQLLNLNYVDLKLLPWLFKQTSLKTLGIFQSTFATIFPYKFWSWAADLDFLSLGDNSNMNWDMSNVLLNSEVIWLEGNGLRGGLPRLTSNVSVFVISGNNLTGSLSPLLCHNNMMGKSKLQLLAVSSNFLSGGLTNCWANWKSLLHVGLGSNNLTGMIPHSMGSLSNLLSLHLDDNKLHGEIPMLLKNCQKLMILNLGKNEFS